MDQPDTALPASPTRLVAWPGQEITQGDGQSETVSVAKVEPSFVL